MSSGSYLTIYRKHNVDCKASESTLDSLRDEYRKFNKSSCF